MYKILLILITSFSSIFGMDDYRPRNNVPKYSSICDNYGCDRKHCNVSECDEEEPSEESVFFSDSSDSSDSSVMVPVPEEQLGNTKNTTYKIRRKNSKRIQKKLKNLRQEYIEVSDPKENGKYNEEKLCEMLEIYEKYKKIDGSDRGHRKRKRIKKEAMKKLITDGVRKKAINPELNILSYLTSRVDEFKKDWFDKKG